MSTIEIYGVAKALSPIVHGGERRGVVTEFRREKMVINGRVEMLPMVSGNAVRGQLRDLCAEFSLNAAGITQLKDIRAFHLLFSAGALARVDQASYINLQEERRLRELLPVVSLFGGSAGNRVLGGKLDVGEWIPLCRETVGFFPTDEYNTRAARVSIYDLLDFVSFTRRDDTQHRYWQRYLGEETLRVYREQKVARQEANEAEEKGESQQMRYEYECLAAGAEFFVRFCLYHVDDVELGIFLGGLALFAARPTIGGRSSIGLGRVRLDLKQVELGRPPVVSVGDVAEEKIGLAQKHLAERREAILQLLGGVI